MNSSFDKLISGLAEFHRGIFKQTFQASDLNKSLDLGSPPEALELGTGDGGHANWARGGCGAGALIE